MSINICIHFFNVSFFSPPYLSVLLTLHARMCVCVCVRVSLVGAMAEKEAAYWYHDPADPWRRSRVFAFVRCCIAGGREAVGGGGVGGHWKAWWKRGSVVGVLRLDMNEEGSPSSGFSAASGMLGPPLGTMGIRGVASSADG